MSDSESQRPIAVKKRSEESERHSFAPARSARTLVRLSVLIASILYVTRGLDWIQLRAAMTEYDLLWLIASFLLTGTGMVLLGIRLSFISHRSVSVPKATIASVFGLALNAVLPAKLGEVAKIVYLTKDNKGAAGEFVSYVFWERFADVNLLLLLACVSVYVMNLPIVLAPLIAATIVFWISVVFVHYGADFIGRALERTKFVAATRLWHKGAMEIRRTFNSRDLISLSGSTTVIWLHSALQATAFFILAASLPITVAQALVVFVLSALSTLVPASPGNVGIFEAAVVFGLGLFDVPKPDALAAGITLHVIYLLPAIVGGLGLMLATNTTTRSILSTAREMRESEHVESETKQAMKE